MARLKSEVFSGIEIVFKKVNGRVIAGFPKNPEIVSARNKSEALKQMRGVLKGFDPVVLKTYRKYPAVMRELEEM